LKHAPEKKESHPSHPISMQFIPPTPAAQLCQTFADIETFKIINARRASPHEETQPFVPIEYVPVTLAELKARAIQATAESQADKSIDHTLHTCECGCVWRSREITLCPLCARHGTILFLDHVRAGDLHGAAYAQKEPLPKTKEQLGPALEEFRALLHRRALLDKRDPWYDKTSRKMIQACYQDLCSGGGTHPKIALAIHFFKEEWKVAPEEVGTFCPEVGTFCVLHKHTPLPRGL
jgi:hypothetical protein